jgi:hypothetical protein
MKMRIRALVVGIFLMTLVVFSYQPELFAITPSIASIIRASVNNNGEAGNSGGGAVFTTQNNVDISGNGKVVAFYSWSSNLVISDSNKSADIFIRDLNTNLTERISVSSLQAQTNDFSYFPSISYDGRYIAFTSRANNLVTDDTNGVDDIFVHDCVNHSTQRISLHSGGSQANGESSYSNISDNGRFITFKSSATNLVGNDQNNKWDVFIHDIDTGVTERVSISSNGSEGNDYSYRSSVSQDGRYVAFDSNASNLVNADANNVSDIFLRDRQNDITTRVSVNSLGEEGNKQSYSAKISNNGKYIIFTSAASNLEPNDTNNANDVFIHDIDAGVTKIVSVNSDGAIGNNHSYAGSVSLDGRFIVFMSSATNLVLNDTNGKTDIFLHDRETGTTQLISQTEQGVLGNDNSDTPAIAADAGSIAFVSAASNLVTDDTNNSADIFVQSSNAPAATPTATHTPTVTPMNTPTATPTATPTTVPTPTIIPTEVSVRVEGKVLDRETQTGIPDVLMTLAGTDNHIMAVAELSVGEQIYTTTTNLNGKFVFPSVKAGAYTLTGVKAGIVIDASMPLTVSGEQSIQVTPLVATTVQPKIYLPLVRR